MGAHLYDLQTIKSAGIDPKTGLPIKSGCEHHLKEDIRKILRITDEANAVNRYVWYNLPNGINGQLLERMLYYRGQVAIFYHEPQKTFYILPYALDGSIDVYGRYTGITPIPFNGKSDSGKDTPWIKGLTKKPVYDIILPEELTLDTFTSSAVILKDYTEQISQYIIPRQQLQEGIIDVESDCIPFLRTALLNSTGVEGVRANSPDEVGQIYNTSKLINKAALEGDKYVGLTGTLDFQMLTGANAGQSVDFLQSMEALDNFRLGSLGIENGGLFQKKAHMLSAEQAMNMGTSSSILDDGLKNRQRWADIVNSIWGLGIYCDISETASGKDKNGDGLIGDEQDQSGQMPGEQMEVNDDEQYD